MLDILSSVWSVHHPNTGQYVVFQKCSSKKAEKGRKPIKINEKFSKKNLLHQNTGRRLLMGVKTFVLGVKPLKN